MPEALFVFDCEFLTPGNIYCEAIRPQLALDNPQNTVSLKHVTLLCGACFSRLDPAATRYPFHEPDLQLHSAMTAAVAFVRDPVGAFVDLSAIPFLIFLSLGAGKRILDGMIIPRQAEGVSDLVELSTLWMGYVWLSNFSGGWVVRSLDDGDIINVLALVLIGCFAVLFGKRAGPFIP